MATMCHFFSNFTSHSNIFLHSSRCDQNSWSFYIKPSNVVVSHNMKTSWFPYLCLQCVAQTIFLFSVFWLSQREEIFFCWHNIMRQHNFSFNFNSCASLRIIKIVLQSMWLQHNKLSTFEHYCCSSISVKIHTLAGQFSTNYERPDTFCTTLT